MTKTELRDFVGNLENLKHDINDAVTFLRDLKNFADEEIADQLRKKERECAKLQAKVYNLESRLDEKEITIARLGMEYGKGIDTPTHADVYKPRTGLKDYEG